MKYAFKFTSAAVMTKRQNSGCVVTNTVITQILADDSTFAQNIH